jgi:glutathione-regulated potassium-efflux system protein KefB
VVSQPLLARGIDVSIIDNDTEMIRAASRFGFKIYYGDGTRSTCCAPPVPAGRRSLPSASTSANRDHRRARQGGFPVACSWCASFDRAIRSTWIAARRLPDPRDLRMAMTCAAALHEHGVPEEEAAEIVASVRERDASG